MSCPQPTREPTAATEPDRRPGWPEILVGLAVFAVVGYGIPVLMKRLGAEAALGPAPTGLILTAVSGVAGILAFLVAARIRVRVWSAFGVRRTSWRWVLAGIGCGLLALVLARLVALLVVTVLGAGEDVQATYRDAAGGGIASLVFSLLFLAVLTPIGEELLFRGVVTTALLRYGGLVGVIGSALVFALAHGFNPAFFTAIVVGLVAAEVRRRSGSVWPGVLVHVVNNLLAQALALLAAGAFG